MKVNRQNIRTIVRGVYDIQKLRIQVGNRIAANHKAKLGQLPGQKEEDGIDSEGLKILDMIRKEYDRVTDGFVAFPKQKTFKGTELISSYTELVMVSQYVELLRDEGSHFHRLEGVLNEVPIYTEFLSGVRGIGPALAGVIISEIDITRSKYPSSIWKYAGLDVAQDGAGRSRKSEHLATVTYTGRDGEEHQRRGLTFNPFLKTKLIGVLGTSFLRLGGDYRIIYDNYKHRLENNPVHQEKSKAQRHNMAIRYMIKRFLVDLYKAWRPLEGLEVHPEYSEAKLGLVHQSQQ